MSSPETESNSLIMCVTPFQMLLAEKIIELNPDKKFDLFVNAHLNDKKHRYYFDRLKKFCVYSLFYNQETGRKGFIKFIISFKLSGFRKSYDNLYLSSIDSRPFQYIVSQSPSAKIYTFDDGTANINRISSFYLDRQNQPNNLKKILWQTIGVSKFMKDIKCLSTTHYTVYENCPNIISNTYPIKLFKKDSSENFSHKKPIKVFLGQPHNEMNLDISQSGYADILNNLNINFYYPHPREKTLPKGSFEVIKTHLIFEDYLGKLIEAYPNTYIHIYSFSSSASLNVANISQVRAKYIYNSTMYKNYKSFYKTVENFFNVELIKIDS